MMAPVSSQQEYWDSVSETKYFSTPFQFLEFKKHVLVNASILDLGCGYGRTLNELHVNGFKRLIGLDFSKSMIQRGNKMFPHLNLIHHNEKDLPFSDNSFDAVLLVSVLTCIAKNNEQSNLLIEISRILKKDGILYLSDFLLNNDQRNINRYDTFKNKYSCYGVFELPQGAILRHYSIEHIQNLTCHFETLSFEPMTYTTMNGNTSNGFYYIGKK